MTDRLCEPALRNPRGQSVNAEMERVFNMGIGLALIFSPYYEATITSLLADAGLPHWKIGHIASGERSVIWKA